MRKLDEFGISHENDEITVTREIMADGGSIARINSKAAAVSVLREIGETLINIHGQHDNQTLLSPEKHIEILDNYGERTSDLQEARIFRDELSAHIYIDKHGLNRLAKVGKIIKKA